MQHHIFLSYSRRNTEKMRQIRDDLRAAGLTVWTDEGIKPGTFSWKEAIETAIRGTGVIVVLLSPSANESVWVQREIDYGEAQEKPIFPLLVEGSLKESVPFALAGSQFIDIRKKKDYDKGLQALVNRCWHKLPAHDAITVASRRAPKTYANAKTQKRNQAKTIIASASFSVLLTIIMMSFFMMNGGVVNGGNPQVTVPTAISTVDTAQITDFEPDGLQIDIYYNRDTLVVYNDTDTQTNLNGIVFEQSENTNLRFSANDWLNQTLLSGRCVQVWTLNIRYLSPDVPPADACESRVAYRATIDTFWVSEQANQEFVLKRGSIVIARCPVILTNSNETQHCVINL